jgi:hypothetical protein
VAVQELIGDGTRFTNWRLRSRACAVIDLVMAAAGAGLFALAAVDSVASWPANHVLLTDRQLARVSGIVLGPGWPWLIASYIMVFGLPRRRDWRNRRDRRIRQAVFASPLWLVGLLVAAAICVGVVVGGFAVGASKGDARVLPGPRYQISTLDLNNASWTSVSRSQFEAWQASFVREDGAFTFFGLILIVGGLGLFQLHRAAPGR